MSRPSKGVHLSTEPNARGFYEIRWVTAARVPGGKANTGRHSTGKTTRDEAERYYTRWRLEAEGVEQALERPAVPTVAEVMAVYQERHIDRNELAKSRAVWTSYANHIAHSFLGAKLVTDLSKADVEAYGADRLAGRVGWIEPSGKRRGFRPAKISSSRTELTCLNAAMQWCVDDRTFSGLTRANLHPVKAPPVAEPKLRWLSREVVADLLAAAEAREPGGYDKLYLFVLICRDTGTRVEAMEQLTWDRVAFWIDDAGLRRAELDFRVPKRKVTRKRRGKNQVTARTAAILYEARKVATSDLVLGDGAGVTHSFRRLAFNVTGREEGPHILRHSLATWLANAGVSMFTLAGILHDTEATVTKHYAAHMPKTLASAVDLLSALRNDERTPAVVAQNGVRTLGVKRGVTPNSDGDTLSQAVYSR